MGPRYFTSTISACAVAHTVTIIKTVNTRLICIDYPPLADVEIGTITRAMVAISSLALLIIEGPVVKFLKGIGTVHKIARIDVVAAVDFLSCEINFWVAANGSITCRHRPARERWGVANNRGRVSAKAHPHKQSQS